MLRNILVHNDAIDKFLLDAYYFDKLVCITLTNNKVYVGYPSNLFLSANREMKSLSLIPLYSGFRDDSYKNINFTIDYYEIYNNIYENSESKEDDEVVINQPKLDKSSGLEVAIPMSQVISLNYFEDSIYEESKKMTPTI